MKLNDANHNVQKQKKTMETDLKCLEDDYQRTKESKNIEALKP